MTKKKIKLFFEDKTDPANYNHKIFAKLIEDELSDKYEISKDYGRITYQNINKKNLMFSSTHDLEDGFTPQKNLKEGNERSKWNLKDKFKDKIPFFVIDTDGMSICSVKHLLGLKGKGPFKTPDKSVHGNPPLLASLLSDCSKFRGISAWGLVLLNPNQEGTIYKSLKIDGNIIDGHLFHNKDECYLRFNWLFAGNEKKRCFFDPSNKSAFQSGDTQISIVKDIWAKIPEVKDIFKDKISEDISKYRYKLVPDGIIRKNHLNPRLRHHDKLNDALHGTIFSLYLRKAKKNIDKNGKKYKDFGLIKQYLNKFSKTEPKENIEIEYFEFIGNVND
jgi:hypothetical protein